MIDMLIFYVIIVLVVPWSACFFLLKTKKGRDIAKTLEKSDKGNRFILGIAFVYFSIFNFVSFIFYKFDFSVFEIINIYTFCIIYTIGIVCIILGLMNIKIKHNKDTTEEK
jgi:hypothetical protein